LEIAQSNSGAAAQRLNRLRAMSASYSPRAILILAVLFAMLVSGPESLAQADNLLKQLEHAAALLADNHTTEAEKEITA